MEDLSAYGDQSFDMVISFDACGGTPWCITYTFMPDELKSILNKYDVKNVALAGPGAYARTIPNELLKKGILP